MLFLDKESKKELKEYKKELAKRLLLKKQLLSKKTDWGLLEEFVQTCNDNPGFHLTVTLPDGTKLDMHTSKESKKQNPLFTEAAYDENWRG